MTKFYSLGPQPQWYLVDNFGRPTAGFLYSYSSLNLTDYKPIYSDQSNSTPYPQPVPFAANGTAGPLYFEFDDTSPDNLYYLEFYDSNNNLLFTINNYTGESSGGGGGSSTSYINLKNYSGNNTYLYNIGTTAPLASVLNNTILCPSNHVDFIDPDIRFFNNNVGGTDIITFNEFTPGSNPLTGDVTPQYYLRYSCSVGGGDTKKYIQFPIEPKVATLDAQEITVTLWARTTGGLGNTITVQSKQFFGTPTPLVVPSIDHFETIGSSITLDSNWTRYSVTGTIPGISGSTISPTHDDALYIVIQLPPGVTSVIDITKVSMYLGRSSPASDFNSTQQVEALIESPRTGDMKFGTSYNSYVPGGWIRSNSTTIGNSSSGSTRANNDTWFLFYNIWNNTGNLYNPVYTSAGTPTTRGVSAQADWEANKRILLPYTDGKVISDIGNSHITGEYAGSDSVSLTATQNGQHSHSGSFRAGTDIINGAGSNGWCNPDQPGHVNIDVSVSIANSGTGAPHENRQPTVYIPCIIKI